MPSRRDFFRQSLSDSSLISLGSLSVPTFLARSAHAAANEPGGQRGARARRRPDARRQRRAQYRRASQAGRLHQRPSRPPATRRQRFTVSPTRLVFTPAWDRWPSCWSQATCRSCKAWATPTPTAPTSARWKSGRPPEPRQARPRPAGSVECLTPNPAKPGDDLPALGIGGRKSLAFQARTTEVPRIDSLEQYRLKLDRRR